MITGGTSHASPSIAIARRAEARQQLLDGLVNAAEDYLKSSDNPSLKDEGIDPVVRFLPGENASPCERVVRLKCLYNVKSVIRPAASLRSQWTTIAGHPYRLFSLRIKDRWSRRSRQLQL